MMIESLWRDLVHGIRMLRKRPGFTLVVVVTLALGIGANTAVFSVVDAALLRRLPYPSPDRLVILRAAHRPDDRGSEVSPAGFLDWRRESRSFAALGAFGPVSLNFSGAGRPERLQGAQISPGALAAVGVEPLLGRLFRPDEERADTRLAILSYGLWESHFGGDRQVLGRVIRLGGVAYPVVGVMPPRFHFPRDDVQIWVPLRLTRERAADRQSRWLYVVGRLGDRRSRRAAQLEMDTLTGALALQHPESEQAWGVSLVPLRDHLVGGFRPAFSILLATMLLVLVIACANVANLQLARAAGRRSEMAIRSAMGASRSAILRQLLVEGLTLAALGGAFGLLLAGGSLRLLISLAPGPFPGSAEAGIDGRVLAFALTLSLLTGIAFGLVPALAARRPDLAGELREAERGGGTAGRGHARARRLLTVAEVAAALVLLIGAGLLLSSLARLQRVEPGFDPDGVVTVEVVLPPQRYPTETARAAFFRQLVERVARVPGVAAAGGINDLPLGGSNQTAGYEVEGRPPADPNQVPEAGFRGVTPGTFATLRIPLLAGRDFSPRDTSGSRRVVIVNRTFAERSWPRQNAIGRRLLFSGRTPHEVIGVVGDIRHDRLDAAPVPEIYVCYEQHPFDDMALVARSSAVGAAGLAAGLRAQVASLDPEQAVFNVKTLRRVVAESTFEPRVLATLLSTFGGVALTLSCLGIYGLISYSVAQRRHELGIRSALGAQFGDLLALLVGEGMTLAAAGILAGLVLARVASRAMASLLFGVHPGDPLIFAATALLLAGAALAASLIPALRAARVDPLDALRTQ